MTVKLETIIHGEANWEGKANQNFNELNSDTLHSSGGVVSKNNLILNSANPRNTMHWRAPVGGKITIETNNLYKNGMKNLFSLIHNEQKPGEDEEVYALTDDYPLEPNSNYDIFVVAFGAVGLSNIDIYMICHDADGKVNPTLLASRVVPSPVKAVLYKFSFNSGNNVRGAFRIDNNGSNDGVDHHLYFGEVFVGKSEFWSPAPGDVRGDDTGVIPLTMVGAVDGIYGDGKSPEARRVNDIVHLTSGIVATADIPNGTKILAIPDEFLGADGELVGFCRNVLTQESFPVTIKNGGMYVAKLLTNGQKLDFAGMTYLGKDV
ncbi:hypothetical protein RA086_05670 [Lactiplantibacillus sp. WILCCON 0030]|uniref:Uncharacterized protein n=1 Tax=Lactiplantibacillus brownii TaxID=3069269 RepID=A0ABU1A9S4_9LACO|nr:hypothetical protein [Lactiplantibacillus brownii]MDQ7937115.1 hypothetical protein [Lactiplantibacillus brownii]